MTQRLVCYHGHRLEVDEAEFIPEGRFVCPLCGSVTIPTGKIETKKPGVFDATMDIPSSGKRPVAPTQVIDKTISSKMPALDNAGAPALSE